MGSIFEEELLEEHHRAQRLIELIEKELECLPHGSIRERKVRGKSYFYLQFREGQRVISKYVPRDQVADIQEQLAKRKSLVQNLATHKRTQKQIEKALGKKYVHERTERATQQDS